MTIIHSEQELENMIKLSELDIKMGNTYSLKEVYNVLYSKEKVEKYV